VSSHPSEAAERQVDIDPASGDERLLDRLRRRDVDAFAELVDGWSPGMIRMARSYVSTDASAQEVVQDTWLAVVRGLDRFEARSSLRTWVFSILRNLARSRGAREARTVPWPTLSDADGGNAGPVVDPGRFRGPDDPWPRHWTPVGSPQRWEPSPEDASLAAELRAELGGALAELPERQRTVVTLRDVHGWSSDEVCTALGLSEANQRVLLHRGRSRLRGRLETRFGEAGR
jgi:RNA polymerase sigma-70 factor (ECF subfamily)